MSEKTVAVIIGLGLLGLIPVWRSGLRENLNFYQFIGAHTIWGPEPTYVPEEYLTQGETNGIYMKIR